MKISDGRRDLPTKTVNVNQGYINAMVHPHLFTE